MAVGPGRTIPKERSRASLRVLGKGCTFRHTTYSAEDHAIPEGGLGVPLNHPRFLEWLGVPDSAWLLEMSPGHWCDTVIQRSSYDGGNATTQGRMSHANKLGHSRPVCASITRNGIKNVTENNWGRPIPKSRSSSRSTGTTRPASLGANGGIRTLETFIGPFAVRDGTSLTTPVKHMQ